MLCIRGKNFLAVDYLRARYHCCYDKMYLKMKLFKIYGINSIPRVKVMTNFPLFYEETKQRKNFDDSVC